MNPSTLTASPSSDTHLPSSFLNPTPLRFPSNSTLSKRRRFRVTLPRSSSSSHHPASSALAPPPRVPKDLNGIELLLDKLSPQLRLATSAVIVAGAVASGYGLGLRVGGSRNAALGGAAALCVAGGAAAYALNASAPQVAAVNLHNYVTGIDDLAKLKKEGMV